MKKLVCILLALLMLSLAGCQATQRTEGTGKVAAARSVPREKFYWDKDLRPMVVLPAKAAGETEKPVAVETKHQPETKEQVKVKAAAPPTTTVSAAEFRPVTKKMERIEVPVVEITGMARTELVAVSDAGVSKISIVYPRPDYGIVQIDKIMPSEARLSKSFEYVIKITNLTDAMLANLVITEELPSTFTFESADPTATVEGKKLTWEMDSLGPRASKQIKIIGSATEVNILEYSTSITHTIRASMDVKVVQPSLELVTVAPTEALLCEQIPIEFVVTNTGSGSAQNVQIVDYLPAGLQAVDGKDKVVLDVGTLGARESKQFSIKLRAVKTGVYANKAIATSASGLRAESAAITTTVRQPILAIAKTGPARQYLGRAATYEITVTNKGDGPAMNTVIEDNLPPGVTSTEATAGAKVTGSKLRWELGTLEPNASQKVRVSYMSMTPGELVSTANASAYCTESVTTSAQTLITGIAALRIQVIDLEDPVEVGATTTYEITVTNQGSAPDTNIRIVCALEDTLRFVSSAGATAGSLMGKTVSFAPLRTLESKGKATWRVIVRGVKAGDVRFKVTMSSDQLVIPVEQTEATHVYE